MYMYCKIIQTCQVNDYVLYYLIIYYVFRCNCHCCRAIRQINFIVKYVPSRNKVYIYFFVFFLQFCLFQGCTKRLLITSEFYTCSQKSKCAVDLSFCTISIQNSTIQQIRDVLKLIYKLS